MNFYDDTVVGEKQFSATAISAGATYKDVYDGLLSIFQRRNGGSQEDYSTVFDKAFNCAVDTGMIANAGKRRRGDLVYMLVSKTPKQETRRNDEVNHVNSLKLEQRTFGI